LGSSKVCEPLRDVVLLHSRFWNVALPPAMLCTTYQRTLECIMRLDRCDLICIDAPRAEAIRSKLLSEDEALDAAERARALSDPTRLTLAAALREGGELCVCDLSWIAGRSQNLVSHHLRALRDRGLVRSRREGKLVMYSLTPAGRSLLGAVAGEPTGKPVGELA
jgi:ArsR family transcriptional regulator, lead/cadmium/zinc/bismuth-responsive transcriptional repressor